MVYGIDAADDVNAAGGEFVGSGYCCVFVVEFSALLAQAGVRPACKPRVVFWSFFFRVFFCVAITAVFACSQSRGVYVSVSWGSERGCRLVLVVVSEKAISGVCSRLHRPGGGQS